MPLDFLDLSTEKAPAILEKQITDERAWLVGSFNPSKTIVQLGEAAALEVVRLVEELHARPLPLLLRGSEEFRLPALRAVMGKVEKNLNNGMGFSVVNALPMDDFEEEDMKAVFWILGQFLCRAVAQKWDGTMIYDVTDTGKKFGYGVRGSFTNVELVFHTDNAFGVTPPDIVGLLCKYPAISGGLSRFCSLYSLHNKMLAEYPKLLQRLYRPMYFDRQAEHAPGAPKITWVPFFRYDGDKLTARANAQLVRKGYDVAQVEMEPELADAINAVEEVGNSPDLWLELPIERGHMQYLNNIELAHYRSHFTDHEDPAKKRHLFRTWHRECGLLSYDG